MGMLPWSPLAGGWLTGRYRKGQDVPESRRAAMVPERYDMSNPANQAKLEAADALAELAEEAGHHADRDVARLPARAPRRHRADHRPADDGAAARASSPPPRSASAPEVLDRIDEIVPPGTTVNPTDDGWTPPAIDDPRLRRRSLQGL